MNTVAEWITVLWLLPLILNIAIPLVILGIWLVVRVPVRLSATRSERLQSKAQEKRTQRRINSNELEVDVSDGTDLFSGVACNISTMGICIMGLPKKLKNRADRLAIVVSSQAGESYSLHVTPRWEKDLTSGRQIGAQVEYAADGWREFVRQRSLFGAA